MRNAFGKKNFMEFIIVFTAASALALKRIRGAEWTDLFSGPCFEQVSFYQGQ